MTCNFSDIQHLLTDNTTPAFHFVKQIFDSDCANPRISPKPNGLILLWNNADTKKSLFLNIKIIDQIIVEFCIDWVI